MKLFMIRYRFTHGDRAAWHRDVAEFIANVENDPELKGRILYRAMKGGDDSYYHLAAAADPEAGRALQSRDFFKRYSQRTREVAGAEPVVTPIEIVAGTATAP